MKLDLSGPRLRIDWSDPSLMLTQAQRQALATDREIVVSAGAGAGKTHTLALRYVALLIELAEVALLRRLDELEHRSSVADSTEQVLRFDVMVTRVEVSVVL